MRWTTCPKCKKGRLVIKRGQKDSTGMVCDTWGWSIRPHGPRDQRCPGSGVFVGEEHTLEW